MVTMVDQKDQDAASRQGATGKHWHFSIVTTAMTGTAKEEQNLSINQQQ